MSEDDEIEAPRRRQVSADALAGREAAALVRELNRQIGTWQASSVKLQTMAQRLQAGGQSDAGVAAEARALFQTVSAEAARFEGLLPQQPEAVAGHGRIRDTRRSFEMVTDRLQLALKLLGSEPPAE